MFEVCQSPSKDSSIWQVRSSKAQEIFNKIIGSEAKRVVSPDYQVRAVSEVSRYQSKLLPRNTETEFKCKSGIEDPAYRVLAVSSAEYRAALHWAEDSRQIKVWETPRNLSNCSETDNTELVRQQTAHSITNSFHEEHRHSNTSYLLINEKPRSDSISNSCKLRVLNTNFVEPSTRGYCLREDKNNLDCKIDRVINQNNDKSHEQQKAYAEKKMEFLELLPTKADEVVPSVRKFTHAPPMCMQRENTRNIPSETDFYISYDNSPCIRKCPELVTSVDETQNELATSSTFFPLSFYISEVFSIEGQVRDIEGKVRDSEDKVHKEYITDVSHEHPQSSYTEKKFPERESDKGYIDRINRHNESVQSCTSPTIRSEGSALYMAQPLAIAEQHRSSSVVTCKESNRDFNASLIALERAIENASANIGEMHLEAHNSSTNEPKLPFSSIVQQQLIRTPRNQLENLNCGPIMQVENLKCMEQQRNVIETEEESRICEKSCVALDYASNPSNLNDFHKVSNVFNSFCSIEHNNLPSESIQRRLEDTNEQYSISSEFLDYLVLKEPLINSQNGDGLLTENDFWNNVWQSAEYESVHAYETCSPRYSSSVSHSSPSAICTLTPRHQRGARDEESSYINLSPSSEYAASASDDEMTCSTNLRPVHIHAKFVESNKRLLQPAIRGRLW